jgi:putative endonuclease
MSGSTSLNPTERLENHLSAHYGNKKFTAKTDDWGVYYFIECQSKHQANSIEKHIKKMKSQIYNRNLKKFPEITLKLLEKFK